MPVFQKASKFIALSAFALSATFFAAPAMRAASPAAASTSADVATPEPQATAPAAAPAAPAAPPTWSIGPISFSGLVDGYYNFNNNHPADAIGTRVGNQLRNFDYDSNSFSLNMAKLSMSMSPAPIGFQVDLGFGKAFSGLGTGVSSCATLPNTNSGPPPPQPATCDSLNDFHLEQAYAAWKPTKGHGLELDFGQFVTSAGAEVIETMNNPNYSRSLLFTYMLPYYHFGLRASMPVTKHETVGFQLVNGWNNITDNNNGKTIGLTSLYTRPAFNWAVNWYFGPENSITANTGPNGLPVGTDKGFRNLIDTTVQFTPVSMPKLTGYLNYDYYQNRNADFGSCPGVCYMTTNLYHKSGIAGEARFQATGTIAFSGRYEYLVDGDNSNDSGGTSSNILINPITGDAIPKATIQEFTITGEYKWSQGLLARAEYRRDHADNPYFVKGLGIGTLAKSQSTLELGIVAFFGPAH